MDEALNLYMIAPKGYEHMCAIIVAPSDEIAIEKAKTQEGIKELTDLGIDLIVVNVTTSLALRGYNVDVSKAGVFH